MRASCTIPLASVAMQNMCKHLKTMFQVLLCICWEGQSMQDRVHFSKTIIESGVP